MGHQSEDSNVELSIINQHRVLNVLLDDIAALFMPR